MLFSPPGEIVLKLCNRVEKVFHIYTRYKKAYIPVLCRQIHIFIIQLARGRERGKWKRRAKLRAKRYENSLFARAVDLILNRAKSLIPKLRKASTPASCVSNSCVIRWTRGKKGKTNCSICMKCKYQAQAEDRDQRQRACDASSPSTFAQINGKERRRKWDQVYAHRPRRRTRQGVCVNIVSLAESRHA